MFDSPGFNPEQGLSPRKNLANQGKKKAVALNCLCCSSGCPACVSSHHHTVYTHGSGTCSASSGRGSNGICSKPFINHPLTTPCGFGQCRSPACCREERLQKQHPWEQASAMLVLECKLNAQHKKKVAGRSCKSPLPSSTTAFCTGIRLFSYYLLNIIPIKLN